MHRVDGGVRVERAPARHRLVEDAAEREDVGAVIDGLALDLLRRHVADRSHDRSHARVRAGPGGRDARLLVRRPGLHQLREAEVEHLREAVLRDHDVPWLEVSVNDPRPVGLGDAVGRLGQVTEEAPQVHFVGVDQLRQRVPVDPLHRDVVDRVPCFPVALDRARPDLVDRDDARVVERRRGLGLDDETPEPLLVADELRRQDLQRDAALEGEILGEIHLAHAAGSQRAHDPIVGNPVARGESVFHGGRILAEPSGSR